MEYRAVVITKGDKESWGLVPELLDRVKTFCTKYDTDTDGISICRLVETHFIIDNPQLFMVACMRGDEMVGHSLASIEVYYEKRVLTIIQLELDNVVDRDIIMKGFNAILSWGMLQGAEDVRISTGTRAKAKMLRRFYGFKPHRMVMIRPLVGQGV
jgi:hypothetical protein